MNKQSLLEACTIRLGFSFVLKEKIEHFYLAGSQLKGDSYVRMCKSVSSHQSGEHVCGSLNENGLLRII